MAKYSLTAARFSAYRGTYGGAAVAREGGRERALYYTIYTHIKTQTRTQTDIPAAAAPRRAATLMVAARAADVSAKVRSTDVSAAAASLIKAASAPDVEASDLLRVCPHASDQTLALTSHSSASLNLPTCPEAFIYVYTYIYREKRGASEREKRERDGFHLTLSPFLRCI